MCWYLYIFLYSKYNISPPHLNMKYYFFFNLVKVFRWVSGIIEKFFNFSLNTILNTKRCVMAFYYMKSRRSVFNMIVLAWLNQYFFLHRDIVLKSQAFVFSNHNQLWCNFSQIFFRQLYHKNGDDQRQNISNFLTETVF